MLMCETSTGTLALTGCPHCLSIVSPRFVHLVGEEISKATLGECIYTLDGECKRESNVTWKPRKERTTKIGQTQNQAVGLTRKAIKENNTAKKLKSNPKASKYARQKTQPGIIYQTFMMNSLG